MSEDYSLMKNWRGKELAALQTILIFFLLFSMCQEKLHRCTVQMGFDEGIGKKIFPTLL